MEITGLISLIGINDKTGAGKSLAFLDYKDADVKP
jgi:hypothetical protein